MQYTIETIIHAPSRQVFAAIHQYKLTRQPHDLFGDVLPPKIVKIDFKILTENTLGLNAIYGWQFWLFGIPILRFQEKVIEWVEGSSVAYQAISGWKMYFRTELKPVNDSTLVRTSIDFSISGIAFLDWLFTPFVKWGLGRVCQRLQRTLRPIPV